MSNLIISLLSQYWGLGAMFIAGVGYYFTHRAAATAYAKSKIGTLMLGAEKYAEHLVLDNGQAKFQWVIDKGYAFLPAPVRLFVSYEMFKSIAQSLFDDAMKFAESHISKQPVFVEPAPQAQPEAYSGSSEQLFS